MLRVHTALARARKGVSIQDPVSFVQMIGNATDIAFLCDWLDLARLDGHGTLVCNRPDHCPPTEHGADELDLRCDETLDENAPALRNTVAPRCTSHHRQRTRARPVPYTTRRRVPCVHE